MGGRPPSVDTEKIVQLTREGWTAPKIAKELGISQRTVQRWRRAGGVAVVDDPRTRWRATPEWKEAAAKLIDEGYPMQDVAALTGVSTKTVKRHFPHSPWTQQQALDHGRLMRQLGRIKTRPRGVGITTPHERKAS